VKLGDLGMAKILELGRSHVMSTSKTTPFICPPEVNNGSGHSLFSPAGDMYMWAVSMCLVTVEALVYGSVSDSDNAKSAGPRRLESSVPDVARLLRDCLQEDRHRRPCSSEARDRVLAAADVWPLLGAFRIPLTPRAH
jgi:hypothetical protein